MINNEILTTCSVILDIFQKHHDIINRGLLTTTNSGLDAEYHHLPPNKTGRSLSISANCLSGYNMNSFGCCPPSPTFWKVGKILCSFSRTISPVYKAALDGVRLSPSLDLGVGKPSLQESTKTSSISRSIVSVKRIIRMGIIFMVHFQNAV